MIPIWNKIKGQATNIAYQINDALDAFSNVISKLLPKDGSEPMTGNLDMNGYDINNVIDIVFTNDGSIVNIKTINGINVNEALDLAVNNILNGFIKDVRQYNSLAEAIAQIGTNNTTLIISNEITVNENVIIPENIKLKFERGGNIIVSPGYTITIKGDIEAGQWQIFDGDGSVLINKHSVLCPEWFGASDDINIDSSAALQNLITSISDREITIEIKNNFYINSNITIPENIHLKFFKGGKLTVNTVSTLTIKGAIDAGLFHIFDGNGAIDLSKAVKSVVTVYTIKELVLKTANIDGIGCSVNVLGYHEPGDDGGGYFYWDANEDKANHNGGTIIDPNIAFPTDWSNATQQSTWFTAGTGSGCWKRIYDGAVNVKWFGAVGDGVTDDTVAIQSAFDSLNVYSSIKIANGIFNISTVIVNIEHVTIFGGGTIDGTLHFRHKNYNTGLNSLDLFLM